MKHVLYLFWSRRESQVCDLNGADRRKAQIGGRLDQQTRLTARRFWRAIMSSNRSAAMTEANSDRLCFLPDRSLSSLHRFRDVHHRRSRLE
jgi:hypothetical protein